MAPSNASHGWRSILAGREILKLGTGWEVGNGEGINVWNEPWLSLGTPVVPIGPQPATGTQLKVSELLCPLTNTWVSEAIQLHLPQYEAQIFSLITSSVSHQDRRIWLYDKSGEYTTRSGYNIARTSQGESDDQPIDWQKRIWSIKTSPKIRDFLWRVAKKAVPVSANLEMRGLPAFACKYCDGVEDDLHTFLLCPFAQEVWTLAPITPSPQVIIPSFYQMLEIGHQFLNLPPLGLTISLWPWILWRLWKARNLFTFENRKTSAQEVIDMAVRDAKEWQSAVGTIASTASYPSFSRPPTAPNFDNEYLVCYVDAAWDANTRNCGIAGVFKGREKRRFQTLVDSRSFVDSALIAEALAVRHAVLNAYTSNAEALIVLSDSQTLIKVLTTKEARKEIHNILLDIYHFRSQLKACSFYHIPRLCNIEADSVAKSVLLSVNSSSPAGGLTF